jgi:hypothetical protein
VLAENIETLRRYHDLLNETGEPPLELFQPDVEVYMFSGSPLPRFQGYRERREAVEAIGLSQ